MQSRLEKLKITYRTLLQPYKGDIVTLLAGCIYPLAFAPFSCFPLTIVSLAIALITWQNITPRRAFWRGWLYGIGVFGVGISWVIVSFYHFGEIPLWASGLLTIGFVAFLASYLGLFAWLLSRYFQLTNILTLLIIFPSAWTLIEWVRGWFLSGFPWLASGYSQIDSPLSGFAPILGVYGVSWLVAVTAGALVSLNYNHQQIIKIFLLLISLWGSGWWLQTVVWSYPIDKPLKVALIQGNIPQEFKWSSNFQIPSMKRYLQLSQQQRDVDLIIWPETAIPLYYQHVPEFLDYLLFVEQATYQTDFLIGIPVLSEDGKQYFNGVTSIGRQPSFYFKRHLVPFGEYIPLQSLLGNILKLLDVPMSEFSAGAADQPNLVGAGQKIGVSICYEDVFGELIRSSLPEATLLVNVSNDAWFGDSIAPHQHLEIARMRALETGRFLLRATNTGISAIIDAKGYVITQAPQFQIHILSGMAQPQQGTTPYVYMGDKVIIGLLILLLVVGTLFLRQEGK